MCPCLSDDLMRCVLSFVPDRKTRSALGYGVDACIRWRIPPPPLPDNPQFKTKLEQLRRAWLTSDGLKTVTAEGARIRSNFLHWGTDDDHAGFVLHTVTYRVNSTIFRVDRVHRYYRFDANGNPACITTTCEKRAGLT